MILIIRPGYRFVNITCISHDIRYFGDICDIRCILTNVQIAVFRFKSTFDSHEFVAYIDFFRTCIVDKVNVFLSRIKAVFRAVAVEDFYFHCIGIIPDLCYHGIFRNIFVIVLAVALCAGEYPVKAADLFCICICVSISFIEELGIILIVEDDLCVSAVNEPVIVLFPDLVGRIDEVYVYLDRSTPATVKHQMIFILSDKILRDRSTEIESVFHDTYRSLLIK